MSYFGFEAIAYQGNSRLAERLTQILDDWRPSCIFTTDEAARRGLAAAIFDASGINVRFEVTDVPFSNAAVELPSIDKNHPLINNYQRGWLANRDLHKVLNFVGGKFSGYVDRKQARVTGDFCKLTCPAYLTTGLLKNSAISSRGIAAIILHELGHVFSFYERLLDLFNMNYAASAVSNRLLKLESDIERVELISEYEKATGTVIADKELMMRTDKEGIIFVKLVSETIKQRRNIEGNEVYSYRGFEQCSDQFAVRHGVGRDLQIALAVIERENGSTSHEGWVVHILLEYLKLIGFMFLTGFTCGMFAVLVLLCSRPLNKIYDDPKERAVRIRNEMLGELKLKITDQRRKEVVADIRSIDICIKEIEDKKTIMEAIWAYMIPSGRESEAKRKFEQQLEALGNNNLFYASSMLETVDVPTNV